MLPAVARRALKVSRDNLHNCSVRDESCTLCSPRPLALEELIKPSHSLQEGGLLRELDRRLADISSDGESMLHIAVEGDLVGDGHLLENVLRFASLLGGEDVVGF